MGNNSSYHNQRNQHNSKHAHHQQSNNTSSPYNDKRGRREWLWHKRLELELEVHNLMAQEQQIMRDLYLIQCRKEQLQRQRPQLIAQILITGLVSRMPAPSERTYHYTMERLIQEETATLQQWNWCRSRYTALNGQIATINVEIAMLDASI